MFKNRSTKKELLDEDNIPELDLYQNLKELDTINHLLGGYNITFNALTKTLVHDKPYLLVDIGSGGGDTLKRIHTWNEGKKYNLKLVGIDLKDTCTQYSKKSNNMDIDFICDDYRNMAKHHTKIDIIHACLFCHHLSENQIIELINFSLTNNSTLIINDLERNPIAYYSIKLLTKLFSKSYLVKNDAPLSVLRGFRKKEWQSIVSKTKASSYSIKNKWAFRHEVIIYG